MSDQFQDCLSNGLEAAARQKWAEAEHFFGEAVRLQPTSAIAAFNLGRIAYIREDTERASSCFMTALAADPLHIKALAALVQTLTELERESEAVMAADKGLAALRARPDIAPASYNILYSHMAHAYRRLRAFSPMAECYRRMLAANPTDTVAQHLLAAAEGRHAGARAADFAKAFFDNMAAKFDKHLQRLAYAAPDTLAAALHHMRPDAGAFATVLDLGCGTGLMGQALVRYFRITRLVGVDLSDQMLHAAQGRGLYAELVLGNIIEVLSARSDHFNLIIAADVFIYVSELSPIFAQARRLLKPGGMFAFSLEISRGEDVELQSNGHYRHDAGYIARLAAQYGFALTQAADGPLRKEAGEDVIGRYVYLAKSP